MPWVDISSQKKYFAGDTSVCNYLIKYLAKFKPIDIAVLPVNEDNFYKRKLNNREYEQEKL